MRVTGDRLRLLVCHIEVNTSSRSPPSPMDGRASLVLLEPETWPWEARLRKWYAAASKGDPNMKKLMMASFPLFLVTVSISVAETVPAGSHTARPAITEQIDDTRVVTL